MARHESERTGRTEARGFALLPRKGERTMKLFKTLALFLIVCGLVTGAALAQAPGVDATGGGASGSRVAKRAPAAPQSFCVDTDGDNYYVESPSGFCTGAPPPGFLGLDCNDSNIAVHPGA